MRAMGLGWAVVAGCTGGKEPEVQDTAEAVELEGAVYRLSVAAITIPDADEGLVDLVQLMVSRVVLLQLHDVSDASFTLRLGFGQDDVSPPVQDDCSPTVELPDASRDGDSFEVGPGDTTFQGPDNTYTIQELHVVGALDPDGESIGQTTLEGRVDLRQAEVLGLGTAEDLCDTLGGLGVACGPCDDGEPWCAMLRVEGVSAARVETEMVAISSPGEGCPTE
jgi:hypothetical protein